MSNLIFPNKIHGLSPNVVKTAEWRNTKQDSPNGFTLRLANFANPLWHFHLEYNYLYDQYPSLQNVRSYNPYSDVQYFMGFYNQMRGGFDDFLFKDDSDYSAAGILGGVWEPDRIYPAGGIVIDNNGHAQVTAAGGTSGAGPFPPVFSTSGGDTSDGSITWTDKGDFPNGWPDATVQLPLVSDVAGNWYSPIQRQIAGMGVEDVTDLIPGTTTVYANGVLQTQGGTYGIEGPGLAVIGSAYAGMYLTWGAAKPAEPITASFQFYFRMMFEEDTQDFEKWAQQLWTIGGAKAKNGSGYVKLVTSRAATI